MLEYFPRIDIELHGPFPRAAVRTGIDKPDWTGEQADVFVAVIIEPRSAAAEGVIARGEIGADYNKLVLSADFASGNNALGGGGAGLYYYCNENISLLTGPVWFVNSSANGSSWKWTVQLDINTGKIF